MKKLLFIFFLLIFSGDIFAKQQDSIDLVTLKGWVKICDSKDTISRITCGTYLKGFMDGIRSGLSSVAQNNDLPPNQTYYQISQLFCAWYKDKRAAKLTNIAKVEFDQSPYYIGFHEFFLDQGWIVLKVPNK